MTGARIIPLAPSRCRPRLPAAAVSLAAATALVAALVVATVSAGEPGSPPLAWLRAGAVVVDCDPGGDDAVAMLLALGFEALEGNPRVTAITLTHGNAPLRHAVTNTLRILTAARRLDIPVFVGANSSLVRTPASDFYFGSDGFGDHDDWDEVPKEEGGGDMGAAHAKTVRTEAAAVALARMAREKPGELTLLCLGPMTNVALAEKLSPGFVSRLRHLVVLGGSVEGRGNIHPGVEFNMHMDPEAMFVALEASKAARQPMVLVPWETVLLRTALPLSWRLERLGAGTGGAVRLLNRAESLPLADKRRRLQAATADGTDEAQAAAKDPKLQWTPADGVAAAVVLRPSLVTKLSAPLAVDVALEGKARAALLVDYYNVTGAEPNAQLILDMDKEGLKRLLLRAFAVEEKESATSA